MSTGLDESSDEEATTQAGDVEAQGGDREAIACSQDDAVEVRECMPVLVCICVCLMPHP